jgi:hypothetical protein
MLLDENGVDSIARIRLFSKGNEWRRGMFQVGDKVVCVREGDGNVPNPPWEPKIGGVYTVAGTSLWFDGSANIDLIEDPECFDGTWEADAFRKIQPCEPEFIELLKRIKPKVDA